MTGPDNNFTFAGEHDINGKRFKVTQLGRNWYWVQLDGPAEPHGPYPTAEGAYLAARGE